jgi:tetratricopeptide (TPR) repeat protein
VRGLPQPTLPAGALADLFAALHEQHHLAGRPSLRQMAAEVGCSHTTISAAFSEPRLPRWGLLELIVETLDGDPEQFRSLWLAASADQPATEASSPTTVRTYVAPHDLPAPVTPYLGRTADLARLDDALRAAQDGAGPRVVLITGPAGVGKTSLAVAWAHTAAEQHADGQVYVDLRGYDVSRARTPAAAVESVLRRLGAEPSAIPRELAERAALLRSVLADRQALFVLDNAFSADQLWPLLPGSPSCFVVVTSRDSLPALVARAGARRVDLHRLAEGDAEALLVALIGPRAQAEPDAVHALAKRCAYLPLALRVAAERVTRDPDAPLTVQVARFDRRSARLDLLGAGGDEQTNVRSVFSWSRRRLSEPAGTLFELLGLSPAREMEVAAAAALLGRGSSTGAAAVDELVLAHLVEQRVDVIGLHDLLRDYVLELAAHRPEGERRAARRRLFDHYVDTTRRATEHVFGDADAGDGRAWLGRNRATLLAVARSAANDSPPHCLEMAALLHPYLEVSGHYGEASALQRTAVDVAQRVDAQRELGAALVRLAGSLHRSGDTGESLVAAERALATWTAVGDQAGTASALQALAAVHTRQGRNALGSTELRRALEMFQAVGDREGEAATANRLGIALLQLGQLDEALAEHERAYEIYRSLGSRVSQGRAANNVGVLNLRLGRYEAATAALKEALDIAAEVGNRAGIGVALANLGDVAERQHHYDDAVESYRGSIEVCAEIGYRNGLADARRGLGVVLGRLGSYAEALETLYDALRVGREAADADVETATLNDIGLVQRLADADGTANHRAAYDVSLGTGDLFQRARALDGMARGAWAGGDQATARRQWQEAAALLDGLGVPEAAVVHVELARLDSDRLAVPSGE